MTASPAGTALLGLSGALPQDPRPGAAPSAAPDESFARHMDAHGLAPSEAAVKPAPKPQADAPSSTPEADPASDAGSEDPAQTADIPAGLLAEHADMPPGLPHLGSATSGWATAPGARPALAAPAGPGAPGDAVVPVPAQAAVAAPDLTAQAVANRADASTASAPSVQNRALTAGPDAALAPRPGAETPNMSGLAGVTASAAVSAPVSGPVSEDPGAATLPDRAGRAGGAAPLPAAAPREATATPPTPGPAAPGLEAQNPGLELSRAQTALPRNPGEPGVTNPRAPVFPAPDPDAGPAVPRPAARPDAALPSSPPQAPVPGAASPASPVPMAPELLPGAGFPAAPETPVATTHRLATAPFAAQQAVSAMTPTAPRGTDMPAQVRLSAAPDQANPMQANRAAPAPAVDLATGPSTPRAPAEARIGPHATATVSAPAPTPATVTATVTAAGAWRAAAAMAPAPPVAGLVQKDAGTGLFDPAAIPVGFVAELDAALAGPGLSPSLGVSGPGAAAAATLPSAVQPDAVVRQIAAQADAAAPLGVEIELDPPELGRIRLMLSPAEAGLTAQLQIERPETLELLRRHAELLLRELAEAGFPDAALSFDLGADAQDRGDTPMPQAADTPRPPAWEQPGPAGQTLRPAPNADHAAPRPEGGRGLDIRL